MQKTKSQLKVNKFQILNFHEFFSQMRLLSKNNNNLICQKFIEIPNYGIGLYSLQKKHLWSLITLLFYQIEP